MAHEYVPIWLAIAVCATLPLTFYVRRAYLNDLARRTGEATPRRERPAAIISASMTLGIVAACSFFFTPAPIWLHWFQVEAWTYMYLLNYSVNYFLTWGKPYPFLRGRLTYVTLTSTLIVTCLLSLSRNNYGHIYTNDVVHPTGVYLTYYGLGLLTAMVSQLLIIKVFIQSITNNQDLTYRIRRGVGLIAMLGVTFGTTAAFINLILFPRYGELYRGRLNLVFYSTVPCILLIPIINAVKQSTLERLAYPLEQHLRRREQQEHALLTYLHHHLTHIAPRVVLRQDALQGDRILVELTHARQVIWSYSLRRLPVSAKADAAHSFALLSNGNIIESSGPYPAPSPWRTSERKHLVQVALHLKKLEAQLEQGGSYDV